MSQWVRVPRRMTTLEYRAMRALFPAARESADLTVRCFETRNGKRCQRLWLHVGVCSFPYRSATIRLDKPSRPIRRSNLWWRPQVVSA